MRHPATLVLLAAGTVACSGADPVSGPATAPVTATLAPNPALLAAVEDAETRVLPALEPAVRSLVGPALLELHAALLSGEGARAQAAVGAVRAATSSATSALTSIDGTPIANADLAGLAVLTEAAEQALQPTARH